MFLPQINIDWRKIKNKPMPETIKKKAILFVHGASYSNYANSIDIFEQKLHKDFKDWKKVPHEKAEYSFQKNKSNVDVFFYKWKERAPIFSERYLAHRFEDSFRTFKYFLFDVHGSKDNRKLKCFILIGAFVLFLAWIIAFSACVYTLLKNFFSGVPLPEDILKSYSLFVFLLIHTIRLFYPHQEIMNLAFLFFAYDKNFYVNGIDCKDHLLTPLEILIKEIIESKLYSKVILVGQSMGGVLLSDATINIEKSLKNEAEKKAIKSKIKLITAGSPHGLLNSSSTESKILDSTTWDFHFCSKDYLHTLIPEKHAKRIELPYKKKWLSIGHYFEPYHLQYLRTINFKEELNL